MTRPDRIGVGRITVGKRVLHSLRLPAGAIYAEYRDEAMRGPAYARNQVLKQLMDAGCDFIFLFDDDCYPIMDGWAEYFVDNSKRYSLHFLGLPEAFKSKLVRHAFGEVVYWESIIGCFNFQTRRFMETVGYYSEEFVGYGYEDSSRNQRAMRALRGAGNSGTAFPSLLRAPSYIFSEDVYARNPTPNMTVAEKAEGIARNLPVITRQNASPQLYYGYPGK